MSKSSNVTLGILKPGDRCEVFGYGDIQVTGQLDCGTLFRRVSNGVLGEPEVLPPETPALNVAPRAVTGESKAPNVDPLIGGAR